MYGLLFTRTKGDTKLPSVSLKVDVMHGKTIMTYSLLEEKVRRGDKSAGTA